VNLRELDLTFLLVAGVGVVAFAARLVRMPARRALDWWATLALLAAATAATHLAWPGYAGAVAFAGFFALVGAPLRLNAAALRAVRRGHEARARRLARLAALLHPGGPVGRQAAAVRVATKLRRGEAVAPAELARVTAGDPDAGEIYRLLTLHSRGDVDGVLRAFADPAARARLLAFGLGTTWVRTVATTGSAARIVDAVEEAERADPTLAAPDHRVLFWVDACAALGDADGTRTLVAQAGSLLTPGDAARAIAAARVARGEPEALAGLEALLGRDDLDPTSRHAATLARNVLANASPLDAPDDPRVRATLARLRAEAEAAHAIDPRGGAGARPYLTAAVGLALAGVYAAEVAVGDATDLHTLWRLGGLALPDDLGGAPAPWRYVTYAFVHLGALHLGFNLLGLWLFGRAVERLYGRARFAAVYLVAAVASGLGVAALSDPSRPQLLVGASGAVFGLGGAMVAALARRADLRRSPRGRQELRSFALLFAIQVASDFMMPHVSSTAHVTGAAVGALLGALLVPRAGLAARPRRGAGSVRHVGVRLVGQLFVDGLDEVFGLDEALAEVGVLGERLGLLNLLERLLLLHLGLDEAHAVAQRGGELLHVVDGRERPVPGDDLHPGRQLGGDLLDRGGQALDAAPARQIDERKTIGHEVVAHVHDVRLGEEDDGVAVGVAARQVNRPHLLAVQVHRELVVERDRRQRLAGRGRRRIVARLAGGHAARQPPPHVLVRHDRGLARERGVAAGVVAVPMRVEHEAHGLVGNVFEGRPNLRRQRRELIVDDHDAVLADRHADVSALALEHVNVARDLLGLDHDRGEGVVGRRGRARRRGGAGDRRRRGGRRRLGL
jgi:membrane associated rhomboid family serine protease